MSGGADHSTSNDPATSTNRKTKPLKLLSFRHLHCLAIIIILAATGLVTLQDFSFLLFSLIYIFFLSKFSFPLQTPIKQPIFTPQFNNLLRYYVLFAAIIGLLLPVAHIIEGFLLGDEDGVKAASPHLFLLSSQVLMEGFAFNLGLFSIPVRVFVPVFYNSRRIFTIVDWLRDEFERSREEDVGFSRRRLCVGKGLAVINMAFWCFNLFGFLLPVYLPKAFRVYYSDEHSQVKD